MKNHLRKKDFYKIINQYKPNKFEIIGDRSWAKFKLPMNYLLRNRYRLFKVFHHMIDNFDLNNASFLDLGPYPGTTLRLLRYLFPSNDLKLYGAGLRASDEFVNSMEKECKAIIYEVNLDPINPDLISRNFNSLIPLNDGTIDYIYAGEIIEHLINPEWILKESFRVLKPGGCIIITTPNITRIGNIFRLLTGRSNYEHLTPIGTQDPQDEWRGHFREYSLKELTEIINRQGFKVIVGINYNCHVTEMVVKNCVRKIMDLIKMIFSIIPHFRDDIFLVAIKS
jgi:SAM-dependent methyltransferase